MDEMEIELQSKIDATAWIYDDRSEDMIRILRKARHMPIEQAQEELKKLRSKISEVE